nr:hypothetical protein Iba_chr03cCG2730 [Ipomoea batatas]
MVEEKKTTAKTNFGINGGHHFHRHLCNTTGQDINATPSPNEVGEVYAKLELEKDSNNDLTVKAQRHEKEEKLVAVSLGRMKLATNLRMVDLLIRGVLEREGDLYQSFISDWLNIVLIQLQDYDLIKVYFHGASGIYP